MNVDTSGRLSASSTPDPATPTSACTSAGALNALQASLDQANNEAKAAGSGIRYVVRRIPGPRHWLPREPVVLLEGPAVRSVVQGAGRAQITCSVAPDVEFDDRLRDRIPALTALLDDIAKGFRSPGLGYDFRVMSWGDGSGVPPSGAKSVIVGTDNDGLLHIRIFDAAGVRTDVFEAKDTGGRGPPPIRRRQRHRPLERIAVEGPGRRDRRPQAAAPAPVAPADADPRANGAS